MKKIAILGAGSWGTALSKLLAGNGYAISLWSNEPAQINALVKDKENKRFLPGIILPTTITPEKDLAKAIDSAIMVVLAVPSQAIRSVAVEVAKLELPTDLIILSVAKGFENKTYLRMSQVIEGELPKQPVAVLSGPSHAEEVAQNMPTAVVVTAKDIKIAQQVQDIFMSPNFRVYTNNDVIGVEVAGSTKNVIALCVGILDGMGMGDNVKAAIITRGLAEITRLGMAMGADAHTFAGLAGVGDLVVTCNSKHSRNRRVGLALGKGEKLAEILAGMDMVAEGVAATQNCYALAAAYNVELPIIYQTYQILFNDVKPKEAIAQLMTRDKTSEHMLSGSE